MQSEYLTIPEFSELMRLSTRTVYRLIYTGKVPAFKVGGSWRIPRRSIEKLEAEAA